MKNNLPLKHQIPNTAHLMIIGAMKAGTTTLFDILKEHPEICASIVKEPEYFSKNQRAHEAVSEYSELFDFDSSIHKYTLEASTGYTKYPRKDQVAENIHKAGLRPKFIYIVRHPIKRIISNLNYWKNFPQWSEPKSNLDHMVDISKYHMQLEQYRQYFPKESFLIVSFEELISKPNELLPKVYAFLNIADNVFHETNKQSNKTNLKGDFELYLRKHFSKWFKYIPSGLKQKTRQTIENHSNPTALDLDAEELVIVNSALKDDMQAFEKEYGVDVSKWGF